MQQLHLVGFTTDHDGLIFSTRRGARSGSYVVTIDDKLLTTLDEALREQADDNGRAPRRVMPRPESALSPRAIQVRLRAGRSIASVASEAGVDEEWVVRFAAPILAEQARVIDQARAMVFAKPRRGPSAHPLGAAVWWNAADRGVRMTDDAFDACWSAHHLRDSAWVVRFAYINRAKSQDAEWEVDLRDHVLVSRNRLASDLGYIEPGRRGRPPAPLPGPTKPASTATTAKRSAASGAARTSAKKAGKRTNKIAAKKTAVRRPAVRKSAAKKTAKRSPARKAVTKTRPAPRKAATRRPAPRKAATPARKSATKRAPAKTTTARRVAPRKAPRKAGSRRPAPRQRPPAPQPALPPAPEPAEVQIRAERAASAAPATMPVPAVVEPSPAPGPVPALVSTPARPASPSEGARGPASAAARRGLFRRRRS